MREIDLIMESDGQLHPLEIKRSVNHGKVLDKGRVPRGNGTILCMSSALSAVDMDNYIIPVWMV